MLVRKDAFFSLTLVGFEKGDITGVGHQEVEDVHELETAGSEGQVGVVALDGQINFQAMDQVGNQDIFEHVEIVFARVEADHYQLADVAT